MSETYRKTRKRFEVENQPRFLTFSCFQRLQLLSTKPLCELFVEHMQRARDKGAFQLHAFVVMPEHVHLILTPSLPEYSVSRALTLVKAPVAKAALHRWKQLDAPILPRLRDRDGKLRFWQGGGGYDRNIRSLSDLNEKIEYIHANPVRRGLVDSPEDWVWSSWLLYEHGRHDLIDPVESW